MITDRIDTRGVKTRALQQHELLKGHPEIFGVVPYPPDKLEVERKTLADAEAAQEAAKKHLVAATLYVKEKAFALRAVVNKNIEAVRLEYGKYADELRWVGGFPIRSPQRGGGAKPADGAEDDQKTEG